MSDGMTEHTGDALSALLDGQLTAANARAVRAHVTECAGCSRELDDVRDARRLVRSLPAVEPPASFLADLLASGDDIDDDVVVPMRRRRMPALVGAAAASVGIAAAIALVVLSPWSSTTDTLDPDLEVAIDQHASTMGALEAEGVIARGPARLETEKDAPPTTTRRQALRDVDEQFATPDELAGYELVEVYEVGDGVHVLYQRGGYGMSVFEREGEIDWDALPDGGTSIVLHGHRAWRWDDVVADGRLIVIEGDGVVITVAGDEPGDAVLDVALAISRSL